MATDEGDFEEDVIKGIIGDVIDKMCDEEKNLNVSNFKQFSREVLDEVYKGLHRLKRMFKYSVTVFLQQKAGAAMNFGASMYADNTADGQVVQFYDKNKYYDLVVSVAGFKITQK